MFKAFGEIISPLPLIPVSLRGKLLKLAGLDVESAMVRSNCYFSNANITIGKNTFINSHSKFFSTEKGTGSIVIGSNCDIAMNVLITTMTHEIGDKSRRAGSNQYLPVTIGDGCWIGANVTILPGVNVGDGCIIAAGAVVNRDCDPNGIYAGVPAKKIKDLDDISNSKENVPIMRGNSQSN